MKDEYIRRQDVVDTINTNADGLEQNGGIPYAQGARAMAIVVEQMPPADVAHVIHCRNCKYFRAHRCMDSMPIEICDLDQTFYDPDRDFCSLAESRGK